MDWRDEVVPKEYDKDEQLREHIKEQLKSFYLYLSLYQDLEKEKERIKNKPRQCGSVIKAPENQQAKEGAQHYRALSLGEIEAMQKPYAQKLDELCKWLDILTFTQYKIALSYIMKYRCDNAEAAKRETGYEKDTIYKYTNKAITRIANKFNKIL